MNKADHFIRKLAEYLAGDQALMSLRLESGFRDAEVWAELRAASPLFGYPTIDEAERTLRRFLRESRDD